MNRPVILCGLGKVGRRVLECLRSDDVPVVVVGLTQPVGLPADVRFVAGDCRSRSVLTDAGVAKARGVIICTSDDLANIASALAVRSLAPHVRIVVRAFNPRLVPRLGQAVKNVVALSVSGLAAPMLALLARTGSALGSIDTSDGLRTVTEVQVPAAATLAEFATPNLALARFPVTGPAQYAAELSPATPLAAGDRLVLCGRPSDLKRYADTDDPDDPTVLWAGWIRRQAARRRAHDSRS